MIDVEFNRYYLDPRGDIIPLIPSSAKKILDIGCGAGMLGKELKRRDNVYIVGIEANAEAARLARTNLDMVIEADIDNLNLPFEKGYFDCIVMADIIEHLKNPWNTLEYLKGFLKETGLVIASIPNARHYSVSLRLLFGRMEYQKEGLLDSTHLHLFTLNSIKKMFKSAGYDITDIKYQIKEGWKVKLLNRILLNLLNEFVVFRYVVNAALIR